MDLDTIIAPTITAVLAVVGTVLTLRTQMAKQRVDQRASDRDDDRDDVQALWAENRRLRDDIASQDKRHREQMSDQEKRHRAEMGDVNKRISKLEGQVQHQQSIIQTGEAITTATLKTCPHYRTVPCPYLVKMHDPDVTPPVRAPELVGGGNPVGGAG